MGNSDKWTTPKQIKIERAGNPRTLKRGILKKGQRKKGVKARFDEILSSKKTLLRYAEWIIRERNQRIKHPEWCITEEAFVEHYSEIFDTQEKKYFKLIDAAFDDGIIDDKTLWMVIKP